jgi:hypothetical protein
MRWLHRFLTALIALVPTASLMAGMPAPLPTPFTKEAYPHADALDPWVDERLQALSFFVAALLACAAGVRWLWNLARHDWPALPALTYRRSLAFTLLWGLAAVVILTMISGARELMTPGAWRKQGWTYKLEAAQPMTPHFRAERRAGLEQLRVAVLQYAALNQGNYPKTADGLVADWKIPAHPGFEFLYRPGVQPSAAGELLIFEPELGDDERFVLLSNGMIGTMRTPEIEAALQPKEP